jgi:hypothetical protein
MPIIPQTIEYKEYIFVKFEHESMMEVFLLPFQPELCHT